MRGCVARTRCIFRNSGCDLLRTGKPTIAGSRRSGQAGCGGRTGFAILAACPGEALRSLPYFSALSSERTLRYYKFFLSINRVLPLAFFLLSC